MHCASAGTRGSCKASYYSNRNQKWWQAVQQFIYGVKTPPTQVDGTLRFHSESKASEVFARPYIVVLHDTATGINLTCQFMCTSSCSNLERFWFWGTDRKYRCPKNREPLTMSVKTETKKKTVYERARGAFLSVRVLPLKANSEPFKFGRPVRLLDIFCLREAKPGTRPQKCSHAVKWIKSKFCRFLPSDYGLLPREQSWKNLIEKKRFRHVNTKQQVSAWRLAVRLTVAVL